MKFIEKIEDMLISFLEQWQRAWWIEIVTDKPLCTYYFGPFMSLSEAQKAQPGYIEDLEEEQAQGITLKIKHIQPKELTIFEDECIDIVDSKY